MFRDLQILCEQWSFIGQTDDINEVNFFSGLSPTLLDTIDLTDYLLANSNLNFKKKREEIDRVEDSLRLFGVFDSLSLTLSNLVTNPIKIFDFFALDNNDTNDFLNYKIKAYKGTELIFQGILKPNTLTYNMPYEFNERKIVGCTIFGWDKEFKDYFSQGEMPDLSSPVNYWFSQGFSGVPQDTVSLENLITAIFGIEYGNTIFDRGLDGNTTLKTWQMVRSPNMINPVIGSGGATFWWQNGYDYIKQNQNLSPFEFFHKLCNAMGWVFYFVIKDNELRFVVRNRATAKSFYNTRVISNEDIIGWNIEFAQYRQKVKAVKLPFMQISGGDKLICDFVGAPIDNDEINGKIKSSYDLVYTKEQTAPLEDHIPYTSMEMNLSSSSYKIVPKANNDYGFSRYADSNEDNVRYTNEFYDFTVNPAVLHERFLSYDTKFMLEVDGGHNGFNAEIKRRKNLEDTVPSDYRAGDNISEGDLIYVGNIGTAMVRDLSEEFTMVEYEQYTSLNTVVAGNNNYSKSAQMHANMECLLTDNSNLILNITIKGFYPYSDEVITFTNPNDEFPLGYEYDIISNDADFTNKVTNYSLRKRTA